MADKHKKPNLAAGPEAALSSACLNEVTASFERHKVPVRTAIEFQDLNLGIPTRDAKGHFVPTDMKALHAAVGKLDGDPKVDAECKAQAHGLEARVHGHKPVSMKHN